MSGRVKAKHGKLRLWLECIGTVFAAIVDRTHATIHRDPSLGGNVSRDQYFEVTGQTVRKPQHELLQLVNVHAGKAVR